MKTYLFCNFTLSVFQTHLSLLITCLLNEYLLATKNCLQQNSLLITKSTWKGCFHRTSTQVKIRVRRLSSCIPRSATMTMYSQVSKYFYKNRGSCIAFLPRIKVRHVSKCTSVANVLIDHACTLQTHIQI